MKKLLSALMSLTMLSAGCSSDSTQGYSLICQYRPGISTVAVPIWTRGKDVYRRQIEQRLTEALVKQIELDTPYKVTSRQRADTELAGTIHSVDQQVLSFDSNSGRPREMEITLVVSFTWTDLRSGKVLLERGNFRTAATYLPAEPMGEDFFEGSEDLLNRLARRIVEQLEIDW